MSMLTARDLSDSVATLVQAMRRVEEGDLDVQLDVAGTDQHADLFRGKGEDQPVVAYEALDHRTVATFPSMEHAVGARRRGL